MSRWIALLALLGSSFVPAGALELVVNGGFEQPVETAGWRICLSGEAAAVDRGTAHDPDPDFEVRLSQGTCTGYARLDQMVDIPGPAVQLTFRARTLVDATSSAWAAAGLIIAYLDPRGFTLAETRICATTRYCPWEDSVNVHVIPVVSTSWQNHALDIAEDLTHFPQVDPERIKRVRISLLAQALNC